MLDEFTRAVGQAISHFLHVHPQARIDEVIGVGNGFGIAGLKVHLRRNLGLAVEELGTFDRLVGEGGVDAPPFRQNRMSFAVAYGLAIQSLGKARIQTNVLPPEWRAIRGWSPGAVARRVRRLLLAAKTDRFFKSRRAKAWWRNDGRSVTPVPRAEPNGHRRRSMLARTAAGGDIRVRSPRSGGLSGAVRNVGSRIGGTGGCAAIASSMRGRAAGRLWGRAGEGKCVVGLVDNGTNKVYQYIGAASRISGSQNAASQLRQALQLKQGMEAAGRTVADRYEQAWCRGQGDNLWCKADV